MREQLDLEDAIRARDAALASVAANSGRWIDLAIAAVARLQHGFTGTAEVIRVTLRESGLPAPHHHNAWGALTRSAVKLGLLVEIGTGQMKTKKSHARRTPIYLRTKVLPGEAHHGANTDPGSEGPITRGPIIAKP